MNQRLRFVVATAAILGGSVGAYTAVSAMTAADRVPAESTAAADHRGALPAPTQVEELESVDTDIGRLPIAATTGREPAVFSAVVSGFDKEEIAIQGLDGAQLTLYRDGDSSCVRTEDSRFGSFSCFDPMTISTGLAHGLTGADDLVYMVGVVPDDAGTVTVNGIEVLVDHNVWQFSGRVDSVGFAVHDRSGNVVAELLPG